MSINWQSIKIKYGVTIIGVAVTLNVVAALFTMNNLTNRRLAESERDLTTESEKFLAGIESASKQALREATLFASLPEAPVALNAYYQTKDLENSIKPLHKAVQQFATAYKQNGDTAIQIHYHTKDVKSFYRSWTKKRGDDLSSFRHTIPKVVKDKKAVWGIEVGNAGLVFRGIAPIFGNQGICVGTVELMQSMDSLYRKYDSTDVSMAFFMDTSLLKITTKMYWTNVDAKSSRFNGGIFVSKSTKFDLSILSKLKVKSQDRIQFVHLDTVSLSIVPVRDIMGTIVGEAVFAYNTASMQAEDTHFLKILLLIQFALISIIIVVVGIVFARLIAMTTSVLALSESVSHGDLRQRLTVTNDRDELGRLMIAINAIAKSFTNLVHQFLESSSVINNSAGASADHASAMAAVSEELSAQVQEARRLAQLLKEEMDRVERSAGSLTENANTLDSTNHQILNHMTSSMHNLQESVSQIEHVVQASVELAISANEVSLKAEENKGISAKVVVSVQEAATEISQLRVSASNITEVITLIREIAEQTKLLALNATIEAARAGEAGKGFAVVANEVKQLANQTNDATNRINETLVQMINATDSSVQKVSAINQSMSELEMSNSTVAAAVEEQGVILKNNSVNLSNAMGTLSSTLSTLTEGISQVNSSTSNFSDIKKEITSISIIISETRNESLQIADSMTQLLSVAESTSTTAIQVNRSAEDLKHLSETITKELALYQVD